jgi:bile acid:Na+ symporter, BASS family
MGDGLVTLALPVAVGIVMLGLGLTLTAADFAHVARFPRAVFVALACQLVLLPLVCLGLVLAADPGPELAVGMMLLAASPGGPLSNLFSHLAGGDVALNITLAAVNSGISVVTLPLVVNLSVDHFLGAASGLGLQADKVAQVFVIVLVPVAIGMLVRRYAPAAAARAERRVKVASLVVLVLVIAGAAVQNGSELRQGLTSVAPLAMLFCLISLTVGYWVPRLARVGDRQAVASSLEIGLHNGAIAIAIALSPALLDNAEMALPAAVYGLLAFIPAGIFVAWRVRRVPVIPDRPVPEVPARG